MIGPLRSTSLAAGLSALILSIASAAPTRAQVTVYDPINHVQAVLTAARALQQVNNQIQSLENQATMLVNQARNLASLPYSALAPLLASVQRTQALLGQAQRIAYSVGQIDQAFTTSYPKSYAGSSNTRMQADAQTRWANAMAGFQDAMRVQAGAVRNLDTTRLQITALVGVSQGATGGLQVAQSGNQLAALQAQQLADLTAVIAAIGRAQSLDAARVAESQAQGQAQTRQFLTYGAGYIPGGAAEFH